MRAPPADPVVTESDLCDIALMSLETGHEPLPGIRLRKFVAAASAAVAASLAAGCTLPPGKAAPALSADDQERVLRNSSMFLFTGAPGHPQPRDTLQVCWSPSCRDSMRFFRDTIASAMTSQPFVASTDIVFTVLPRHEHDLALAIRLRSYDQSSYGKLMLSHLVYGARQDRFLTPGDSEMIIARLSPPPDRSGLYDAAFAGLCLSAVPDTLAKRVARLETPTFIFKGVLLSPADAADLVERRMGGRA